MIAVLDKKIILDYISLEINHEKIRLIENSKRKSIKKHNEIILQLLKNYGVISSFLFDFGLIKKPKIQEKRHLKFISENSFKLPILKNLQGIDKTKVIFLFKKSADKNKNIIPLLLSLFNFKVYIYDKKRKTIEQTTPIINSNLPTKLRKIRALIIYNPKSVNTNISVINNQLKLDKIIWESTYDEMINAIKIYFSNIKIFK